MGTVDRGFLPRLDPGRLHGLWTPGPGSIVRWIPEIGNDGQEVMTLLMAMDWNLLVDSLQNCAAESEGDELLKSDTFLMEVELCSIMELSIFR